MENNSNEMSLSVIVNPGTVIDNFNEFKTLIKQQLDEKYSTIEVSEERLKDAKEARAKLNKAKASLKEAMRSAQAQNDEPLVVPKQQAKELEQLLDSYIVQLDSQIKEIEAAQREERLRKAGEIFLETVATYPPEVQEIAVQCKWTVNEKWANATYSQLQVKKDCKAYCDDIEKALQSFEGEFRPQMLADYIKNGNLSNSLLFGIQLRKQKEAYEAAQKAKAEAAASKVNEPTPEKTIAQEPASDEQEPVPALRVVTMMEVISPVEFMGKENANARAFINLRITAPRYMIEWIMAVMKNQGMAYERITTPREER